VQRSEVRLAEGPFRQTGEHIATVHLHTDVNAEVTVIVEAE
jgi:large subunit ribosomal protein L9